MKGSTGFMRNASADLLPCRNDGFVLRRLAPTDLPEFQAYRSDEELGRYQGWTPMSDQEGLAFLTEMNVMPLFECGAWTQIGIAEPGSDDLIGDIGVRLEQDGRSAEIGFTLVRRAQGRGIATLAVLDAIRLVFSGTAVERIIGITDARNVSSIRLLERVGMRRMDAVDTVFRGQPCIEYVYALQRDETG